LKREKFKTSKRGQKITVGAEAKKVTGLKGLNGFRGDLSRRGGT